MKNNSSNSNKKKRRVELRFRLNLWRVAMFILLLLIFAPFFASLLDSQITGSQIELSGAIADVKEGKVENVEVEAERLTFIYKDGTERITTKEANISFAELLDRSGVDGSLVKYRVVDQTVAKAMGEVLGVLLPLILMAAFFVFLLRSQNRGAQDIFSFGKSKAKIFAKGKQDVTFNDVAGVDDAKKELEEVVDFLKNPLKYRKIGARTPKGVLLVGPAGVGKTLLARAVAGEAGVPFFSMAGSEFMEMLVGVGASRVRDLFQNAKTS